MAKTTLHGIAESLRKNNGNVAAVARSFRVTRQAIEKRIKQHPELQEVLAETRETMLDEAEDSLYKMVKKGEGWAVCFFLKTQGRKRGYIEKAPELPPLEVVLAQLPAAIAAAIRTDLTKPVPAN